MTARSVIATTILEYFPVKSKFWSVCEREWNRKDWNSSSYTRYKSNGYVCKIYWWIFPCIGELTRFFADVYISIFEVNFHLFGVSVYEWLFFQIVDNFSFKNSVQIFLKCRMLTVRITSWTYRCSMRRRHWSCPLQFFSFLAAASITCARTWLPAYH